MPELSIIVPVYKVEKYLPRCIDSILAQTFRDFELILIDDGSPDNCGAICDEYAARDSRIKVIHQENAGVSAARNAGLDIATGTYLGFVDSDDWIEPEMYETMIASAKEKQVDVVVCGVSYAEEDGTFIRSDLLDACVCDTDQLLSALFGMPNPLGGGCCNKLFRRTSMKKCRFREGVAIAEDWLFLFDCFCSCQSGVKLSDPYYHVVERSDSATRSDRIRVAKKVIETSEILLEQGRKHSLALESLAVDKFLDDCLRYGAEIKDVSKGQSKALHMSLLNIKCRMGTVIIRAFCRKLLPRSKLNGYIMGALNL